MKTNNAAGGIIVRFDKEAKADYSLICFDNNQANKYNYENNGFMWHKTRPFSGVEFSRGAATLRLISNAIIQSFSFNPITIHQQKIKIYQRICYV